MPFLREWSFFTAGGGANKRGAKISVQGNGRGAKLQCKLLEGGGGGKF